MCGIAVVCHGTRAIFTAASKATESAQFLERVGRLTSEPELPDAEE